MEAFEQNVEPMKADGEIRTVLVGVQENSSSAEEMDAAFAELTRLCDTAGLSVVAELSQTLDRPNSATCIGSGKLKELSELCEAQEIEVVVFDTDLTPSQIKNIEDAVSSDVRVIDRTMLILDIFAKNAVTGEGMLQVEIAQLKYNVPRLTGKGKALSCLGGGIGTRGPGESKLETDRRHVRRKIASLEQKLSDLSASRALRRKARAAGNLPQITIAGYTNAGKSTLLNYLTDAGILAEDKLFATLDPTTRRMKLEGAGEILLTDTVGFIDRLPHSLVEAFASTLDEVAFADLVLVVLDASSEAVHRHLSVTEQLVAEIFEKRKVQAAPIIYVYNKCDLLEKGERACLGAMAGQTNVFLSARTGEGVPDLLSAIEEKLSEQRGKVHFVIPHGREEEWSFLYRRGSVEQVEYKEDSVEIRFFSIASTSSLLITISSGFNTFELLIKSISVLSDSSSNTGLLSETYPFKGLCFCLVADFTAVITCLVMHSSANARKDACLSS